jgi:predicted dehydrogenase
MKVLLIWLGKMWQFHLKNLLEINEITKIYAFDIMIDNFIVKDDKITYINNINDLSHLWKSITIADIDFVDIVAPTKFHKTYLDIFIKNNKNIFVEKPMVSSLDELDDVAKLIEDTWYNQKIWVWFIERFNVVTKQIKEQISKKWDPKLVEFFRYNPWSDRIMDTDVTSDLMIHDIDLLDYFFDWNTTNIIWKNIDNESSTVLAKNGSTNIMLSANRITQQKIRQIKVYYPDVTIIWDLILWKIEIFHKPSKYLSNKGQDLDIAFMLEEKILPKTNQLKEELLEFIDIINWSEYKTLSTLESSRKSMKILSELTS